MLLLSCPVRWCGSCPTHPIAVLASTAVMSHSVLCRVCGVWVVGVCLCCSCDGVSSVCPHPYSGGGWGYRRWWGGIADGGWHGGEGAVVLLTPSRMSASPSVCWCPPYRLPCSPVEWRGRCVLCCPVFGLGPAPCIVCPPSHCPFPFRLVLPCLLWVGKCGGAVSRSPLPSLCSLSQHCWFGAVSLWQGYVIAEWW